MSRYLIHVKRKLRVILISAAALIFTALLAFYNNQEVVVNVVNIPQPVERFEEEYRVAKMEEPAKEEKITLPPIVPKAEEIVREFKEVAVTKEILTDVKEIQTDVKEISTAAKEILPKSTPNMVINIPKSLNSTATYPALQETIAEFDTYDIYKTVIARQAGDTNASKKLRSPSTGKLRVFILPFTHVDPGWLKTFDAYSEDTNKILDNMHNFMTKNPKMRFMWAEFVFFERWWKEKNETIKEDVRKLVKEGRFELASGSWVMTDEANAYFPVSVDNIIEGHQFLLNEFGIKPSTIWSNDPFGYSNSVPYLFRQAGIKRNVINRIHHGIKGHLQQQKGIPFQWRQYWDSNGIDDVLTQVLPYSHYDIINSCGPNGAACCEFDFKRMTHWACPGPKPVPITVANVKTKAQTLVTQLQTMSNMYEAPVLLQMHGDDFRFDMIEEWHQHHDNFLPLFDEINKGSEVEISFGTFTDYFNELEKWYETNQKQPASLTGDFFPYKCALGDLWTGYFTTRPFYKRQGRMLHNLVRSADIAMAKNPLNEELVNKLEQARRTLSLFQHHDAITGTSKIHVMKDYSKLLFEAQNKALDVLQSSLKTTLKADLAVTHSTAIFNETQTKHQVVVSREAGFISIFNPLPYSLSDTVSLRVNSTKITISLDGQSVSAQIEPYIYKGDLAQDDYLLSFPVKLTPLGVTVYEMKEEEGATVVEVQVLAEDREKIEKVLPKIFKMKEVTELSIKTEKMTTKHDSKTGLLTKVSSVSSGDHATNMSIVAYKNAYGGAYLMKVRENPTPYLPSSAPKMLIKGPVQQSIHLFLGNIYHRMTAKEVDGPLGETLDVHIRIDIHKETNTEVALRIETDLKDSKVFGDSVGLQLLRRESHSTLDNPSNYYPMPSAAVIENDSHRLTISSNVEHGMMQLSDGVEIMIDRILRQDDGKGLGSGDDAIPTDMLPVDMQFSLLFENRTEQDSKTHYSAHTAAGHLITQNVLYSPIVIASSEKPSLPSTTPLPSLPCDYQLLTIRPVKDKKMLIIFRHGTVKSTTFCGNDITIAIHRLLQSLKVTKIQETNLSGTEKIGEEKDVSLLKISVPPFKFLALIAS